MCKFLAASTSAIASVALQLLLKGKDKSILSPKIYLHKILDTPTLAVRLSLIAVAESVNAQSIVTGLNLEDILAECLLTTMQGKLPFAFPVRIIDGVPLWFPLYNIPKKILDGCYPKYSLANYEERYPSKMLVRANVYYLAQMLNALIPGAEFDLLDGFKKLASQNKDKGYYDEKLGFSVVQKLPLELKNRWMMFIQM